MEIPIWRAQYCENFQLARSDSVYDFLDHFNLEEENDYESIKIVGIFFCSLWKISEQLIPDTIVQMIHNIPL
jgi:hypothetical protein